MLKSVLPRRLIRLRHQYRLTEFRLAREAGISPATLSGLESGLATDMRLSTLLKLCRVLGVSPDYLLGLDDHILVRSSSPSRRVLGEFGAAGDGRGGACAFCGIIPARGDVHVQSECITQLFDGGKPVMHLSALFGLHPASIEQIVRDEYELRRRIRWPDGPSAADSPPATAAAVATASL
jgi:DNA-binding Xre family transcriptional regulator